jgi:hypothetical protein
MWKKTNQVSICRRGEFKVLRAMGRKPRQSLLHKEPKKETK